RVEEVKSWHDGCAYLAGGTWLFSEPQVHLRTLIDLDTLKWPPLTATAGGLEIAATCKVVDLDRSTAPPEWLAAPLLSECCHSFLASFKIWNEATVGGNLIMSLPAGPMISLTAALEGVMTLWPRGGAPREVRVADFVTGNHQNDLQPGELVRSILLPAHALKKKYAFRRFTLTHLGRSETLVIGTLCPEHGEFLLTVTASTLRPWQFHFEGLPTAAEVRDAIDGIPLDQYLADTHGSPEHRQHLTYYFSEQIRQELSA
ncbi:MAG TPA: FAD binding domain-containing protein, partial [Chthoniobacterales bacterium]